MERQVSRGRRERTTAGVGDGAAFAAFGQRGLRRGGVARASPKARSPPEADALSVAGTFRFESNQAGTGEDHGGSVGRRGFGDGPDQETVEMRQAAV